MKKNFMFGSVIVAILLLGTGCGGGSSSSSDDGSSTEGSASVEKTGYYLDSAVGGASYSCVSKDSGETSEGNSTGSGEGTTSEGNGTGSLSGTTNADGSFQFQDGQICTFSIGGVVLRKVDTTGLSDNAIVLEDNPVIARLLQTLDNNDYPDDGIQIDPAVSASIASENLIIGNDIPTTDEELANLVTQLQEKVPTYNGQAVTEEAAQSHLSETRVQVQSMNGIMEISTGNSSSGQGDGSSEAATSGTSDNSGEGSSESSTSGSGEGTSSNGGTVNTSGNESSTGGVTTDTPAGNAGGMINGSGTTTGTPTTSPSTRIVGS